MKQATVNQVIHLSYPDSFQDMTAEELRRYFGTEQNRWGVYDAERHAILSVNWSKAGFFSFLTDPESKMISVEAKYKRSLINYRSLASAKTKIAKQKGYGLRFEYRANNSNMYQIGEIRMIKYKGNFYSFQYVARRITDESCHPDFVKLLESVSLG